MWKHHPKALPYLFFSELWERFGYYLMIGIFVFYLEDAKTGFGLDSKESASLYGTFIALVFFTPFLGGLIADRILGYQKSIILGGLLMGIGYCTMGFNSYKMLYISMALVIVGNGFFKPNISTLLGNVYSTPQYSRQKDEGYNIFYMGINIGAFVCNFFGAILYITIGWKAAFFAAGIGMFIGVAVFVLGRKHYKAFDTLKPLQPGDMSLPQIFAVVILPSIIFGIIGWYIKGNGFIFDSNSTDAFIFACIPVLLFYGLLVVRSNKEDRPSMSALLTVFIVVILFWAIFKQNGSALNNWAKKYTDREVKGTIGAIFQSINLSETTIYKKDSTTLLDNHFRKITDKAGKEQKGLDYPFYFKNVASDNLPAEGTPIQTWAPSLSQSINPGWVILLTPAVVAFFAWLRRRKKEPTTATKITLGLFISALSVLVMVAAVKAGNNGAEKVSVLWLIASYGVITIGELFLSPMGLSMVSKLSPPRITSLMMGGWFLATSIGNKLSGILASKWDEYDNKANYFLLNFILLGAAALLLFLLLGWLNKVMKSRGVN